MTDYYVSISGSNSNSGTSAAQPFQTLERALTIPGGLRPGDTVHVMTGTYNPVGADWRINNVTGTAAQPITIKAYSGHSPVFSGARAKPHSGWPTVSTAEYTAAAKAYYDEPGEYANIVGKNMVFIQNCSYLVWDGIDIKDSLSRCLTIYLSDHVTIKNTTIGPANNIAVNIERAESITMQDCEVTGSGSWWPGLRAGSYKYDWQASIAIKGGTDVLIERVFCHDNWGEAFIADANKGNSSGVTVRASTFRDNMRSFFIQAARDVLVERCLFYDTQAGIASGIMNSQAAAMGILSEEKPKEDDDDDNPKPPDPRLPTRDVIIRNNVFLRCSRGGLQIRGSANRELLANVDIYNNTFSYCEAHALELTVVNKSGIGIKNNIINASSADKLLDHVGSTSGFTANHNMWSHDISATEALADGADDVYGDPGLVDEDYWPRANDVAGGVSSFRLTSGSNARGAGLDLSAEFDDDHFGQTRSAWDIGAHEYDGNSALSASAAATNSPQQEGSAISFTGAASGGTAPYTYSWTFGDGNSSASQNPSHPYAQAGTYTATLTVIDSSLPVQTATDTVDVLVQKASTGSGTPVDVRQVAFNVGDATFNPGIAPKAIIFVYGGGASAGTIAANAALGFGIWAGVNQYAVATVDQDNVGTSNSATRQDSGVSIMGLNPGGSVLFTGAVSSASASSVAMEWTGTTSGGERVLAYVFGGSDVTATLATSAAVPWDGTAQVSGNYNLLFCPATVHTGAFGSSVGQHRISAGFAIRDGGSATASVLARDNQDDADVRGAIRSGAVARMALTGSTSYVTVDAWNSSGITLRMNSASTAAGTALPLLLLRIESTAMSVGIVDLPTATGVTNYSHAFNPQLSVLLATTLTTSNEVATDATAGPLLWAAVDANDVDQSVGISSKDAVASMVAKSLTDTKFAQLGSDGTVITEGALTNETGATRLNLTTAAAGGGKAVLFALESRAANDIPAARFDVQGGPLYYDSPVTFTDLSASDGTHNTLSYDWDWGDGSTHGVDADMSGGGTGSGETIQHTYTQAGTYTVTLAVTDNNSDVGTYTEQVVILPPLPTFDLDVSPTSGEPPLLLTLDATGCAAGGDETLDLERSFISVIGEGGADATQHVIHGLQGTVLLTTVDTWSVRVSLIYNGYSTQYVVTYPARATTAETREVAINTTGGIGPFTAVGPIEIAFALTSTRSFDGATIAWDFGDNDADPGLDVAETVNTFAAVTTPTSHDVVATVDWPDGSQTVETLVDWVTIIPAPRAPVNIQRIGENMGVLRAHLGILAGKVWAQENAPNSNVWRVALAGHEWADGMTVRVVENGALLTAQASVAAAQAAAGSSYYTYSGGTLTVYVHPTTGDNPNINGRNYRWID